MGVKDNVIAFLKENGQSTLKDIYAGVEAPKEQVRAALNSNLGKIFERPAPATYILVGDNNEEL